MLACYYSQGKQLASGVIGLLTCQSHHNVSVINTTPCARLLLCHPLDQRIPTQRCKAAINRRCSDVRFNPSCYTHMMCEYHHCLTKKSLPMLVKILVW